MIEIIPKPAAKLPFWQNFLFYFSLGLLLVTILTYFILDNSIKKAEISLNDLEETLAKERTAEKIALEKEVLNYQKKIADFSKILAGHLFSSKFFEFIDEKNINDEILFSKMNLKPRQAEVSLSGQAKNCRILKEQIKAFKNDPKVEKGELTKINMGNEGQCDFGLNLKLDPDFFK